MSWDEMWDEVDSRRAAFVDRYRNGNAACCTRCQAYTSVTVQVQVRTYTIGSGHYPRLPKILSKSRSRSINLCAGCARSLHETLVTRLNGPDALG